MKDAWHDISYSLTYQEAAEILRLVSASSTATSLDLEVGTFRLRLSKVATGSEGVSGEASEEEPQGPESKPVLRNATERAGRAAPVISEPLHAVDVITPTLGVFYRRPSPDAEPFVVEGDVVHEDDQIGLLEVMKLYTPVVAGVSGRVVEILAPDASLVEHGQVLMRIDTGKQD